MNNCRRTEWYSARLPRHKRPVADIEQGHISTTSCILANMTLELGRTLQWDPAGGKIVGDDEANRLMRRPYRGPWALSLPTFFISPLAPRVVGTPV